MKKMDLERLQVQLSDERFEVDPFPSAPHGLSDPWNVTGWETKQFRRCNKCKTTISDYNTEGFCDDCRMRPCVYRCGNQVPPNVSICESCQKEIAAENRPPSLQSKKRKKEP